MCKTWKSTPNPRPLYVSVSLYHIPQPAKAPQTTPRTSKCAKRSHVRQPSWRGVANERVARSRSSSPDRPRVMRCRPRGRRRSVDRGKRRPAIQPRKRLQSRTPTRMWVRGRPHRPPRQGERRPGPAGPQNPRMRRNTSRRRPPYRRPPSSAPRPGAGLDDRSWESSRLAAERQPRSASTIPHQGAPR